MNKDKAKSIAGAVIGYGIAALILAWFIFGNHRTYALLAGMFYYYILVNNGIILGPIKLYRRLVAMRDMPEGHHDGESLVEPQPFCVGCPDHEACSQGACHLDGGPNRPLVVQDEPYTCTHPGGHPEVRDPMGILGYSCEDSVHFDVRSEGHKTQARKDREATESMRASERGEDLSFLKDAPVAERREWVESWAARHPGAPRSEIARTLHRVSGVSLRMAQMDVKAALGPAALRSQESKE